jgi:GNAT superfamily N-acetyltransferase
MIKVEQVGHTNRVQTIDSLKSNVIRNVFAYYDLQYDPKHTIMHAAFQNGRLYGYVLTYTGTDVPSVILECPTDIAATLLDKAPTNNFIMHTSPQLLKAVQDKYPKEKHYVESWMLVKKGRAEYFRSDCARKLEGKEDASRLAILLSSRNDRPRRMLKRYTEWIGRMPLYGVFLGEELVSYAGSFIQLPQVWMIGGVYTAVEHRCRGYATSATSAVTEEALRNADAAALFARSDNRAAIKVYERIGYRKIGEKVWVDVGTGLKP